MGISTPAACDKLATTTTTTKTTTLAERGE
jgi:hypothetical protein